MHEASFRFGMGNGRQTRSWLTRRSLERTLTGAELWLAAAVLSACLSIASTSLADDFTSAGESQLTFRLDQLEAENDALRSRVDALECQPSPTSAYTIDMVGRIHLDYWAYPGDSPGVNAFESGSTSISPQDRFELRRARFGASGRLPLDMRYALDIELSEASNPQFRDVYIGWDELPVARALQLGNQKRPYGLDQLNSSNFNVMMERPFVVQALNRNARRFGLASYGYTVDETWNWTLGTFNLAEIQSNGAYISDSYQLELAGRLARSAVDACDASRYVHVAVSSTYAEPDGVPAPGRAPTQARFRTEPEARTDSSWLDTGVIDGTERYGILGLETVLNFRRLQLTGEYMQLWLNRRAGFGDPAYFHGGYLQAALFLTDHYQPWNRKRGVISRVETRSLRGAGGDDWPQALQIAVRWSYADLSDQGVLGGVGESIALGVNWYWTRQARLQLNCLSGNIWQHAPVDGQTFGSYLAMGTRVMIDF